MALIRRNPKESANARFLREAEEARQTQPAPSVGDVVTYEGDENEVGTDDGATESESPMQVEATETAMDIMLGRPPRARPPKPRRKEQPAPQPGVSGELEHQAVPLPLEAKLGYIQPLDPAARKAASVIAMALTLILLMAGIWVLYVKLVPNFNSLIWIPIVVSAAILVWAGIWWWQVSHLIKNQTVEPDQPEVRYTRKTVNVNEGTLSRLLPMLPGDDIVVRRATRQSMWALANKWRMPMVLAVGWFILTARIILGTLNLGLSPGLVVVWLLVAVLFIWLGSPALRVQRRTPRAAPSGLTGQLALRAVSSARTSALRRRELFRDIGFGLLILWIAVPAGNYVAPVINAVPWLWGLFALVILAWILLPIPKWLSWYFITTNEYVMEIVEPPLWLVWMNRSTGGAISYANIQSVEVLDQGRFDDTLNYKALLIKVGAAQDAFGGPLYYMPDANGIRDDVTEWTLVYNEQGNGSSER